jgi:hypothetical protein
MFERNIVTAAVIQLEQVPGDAAFHLMGGVASSVLLGLQHHRGVVAGGQPTDTRVEIQSMTEISRRNE